MVDRRPSDPNVLTSQYDVTNLVYPPDLGYLRENENYVAFYINVPGTSKIATTTPEQTIGELDQIAPGTVGQNTVSLPGTSMTTGTKVNYRRLKAAIVLPIMERPVTHYGADWDMVSLGPIVGWAMSNNIDTNSMVGAVSDAMSGDWKGLGKNLNLAKDMTMDAVKALSLSAINTVVNLAGMGGSASAGDMFGIIRRTALNEHRTQLFKSMRFRNFQFEYHLAPKSIAEATTIKNIIYQFKYHMHAENNNSDIFLTYPSEFDVVFYFQGSENGGTTPEKQNLFKISTCALTDMEVEYGGDPFYTFKDGMPTEIVLKLTFMELELLTKERIQLGF